LILYHLSFSEIHCNIIVTLALTITCGLFLKIVLAIQIVYIFKELVDMYSQPLVSGFKYNNHSYQAVRSVKLPSYSTTARFIAPQLRFWKKCRQFS